MPRERIDDPTTPGRYTQVNWRRDEGEPGYVQVSTHGPDGQGGEYVHHDKAGLDRLLRTLHKARRKTFGDTPELPRGPVRVIGDVMAGPGDCWVPTGPNGEGYWV